MEGLRAYSFSPSAWIQVTGDDAPGFLQGQCSNDVAACEPGSSVYCLWLSAKGKIEGDSLVLSLPGGRFILFSRFTPADVLLERLEKYVIADDVELDDRTGSMAGYSVWGPDAAGCLERAGFPVPVPGKVEQPDADTWVLGSGGPAGCGYDILLPAEGVPDARSRMDAALRREGASVVGEEVFHYDRIRSGMPAVMIDLGPDNLPQEGALEARAISYDKGCYTGQEVMARLRHKGRVRRKLVRGHPDSAPAGKMSPVFHDGKKAGLLTSWGKCDGELLAFVLLDRFAFGADRVSLAPDGERCVRISDSGETDGE